MTTPNVGEDVEQPEFSYTAGGNAKQLQPLWKTAWQSRNVKQTLTIQSSHPTLKYLPQRNKNLYSHRKLYANIYSHSSHNCQTWKQLKCHQQTAVRLYNGKLLLSEGNELLVYVTTRMVLKCNLLEKETGHKLLYYMIPII